MDVWRLGGPSPLHAGFWTLPYIVVNIAGAMLVPRIALGDTVSVLVYRFMVGHV